jgi:hypothetical protein
MSTSRRIVANRANARASTGPQTSGGKARTSRNARRHGLSVPITSDPILAIEVEELARRLVGDLEDAEIAAPARAFAEAAVDLARVKRVRLERIRHLLALRPEVENPKTQKDIASVVSELAKLDRYDRRARARRKLAARAFTDRFIEAAARQGLAALGSATIWECRDTDAQSQPGLGESWPIGRTEYGAADSQD